MRPSASEYRVSPRYPVSAVDHLPVSKSSLFDRMVRTATYANKDPGPKFGVSYPVPCPHIAVGSCLLCSEGPEIPMTQSRFMPAPEFQSSPCPGHRFVWGGGGAGASAEL